MNEGTQKSIWWRWECKRKQEVIKLLGQIYHNHCKCNYFFTVNLLLFYVDEVSETNSSLVNIMIGMYVATQVKIIDYWFREKKDAEHEETNGNQ